MLPRLLISILITLFTGVAAHGQVLHTVHAGTSGARYAVDETPGSLYEWHVEDGGVISASYNNQIDVDWGISAGIFEIWVVETNLFGCVGDTVRTLVEVTDRFDFNPFPSFIEICEGETYIFDAGNGFVSYLWNDDSEQITQTFAAESAGKYWVQVVDENGLVGSDTVELVVNPMPFVDLGPDTTLMIDESLVLDAGNAGSMYTWSTGAISQTIVVHGTDAPVTISVEVTTMAGCIASDEISIELNEEVQLIIPTIITPNEDGSNDTWIITDMDGNDLSINFPKAVVEIFNRWGETVYRSQPGYTTPWDGTYRNRPLQMDSYHYVITFNEPGLKDKTGNITIVR
ncbi:MAG: gliding motility-associated C-terminal domain-containing protein [Bacteroidales bacterium]